MNRRRAAGLAVLLAATAALFVVSRGRWSDPLIDSGREWIVPDALSRGGLLYRDVVYWFGPFTPYFQALFFRLFGSGFASLVAAGAATAAGTLAALYAVLARVTGRRDARLWTALAIPALVFMPNAGGALLGMGYRIWQAGAFALAAVAVAASTTGKRSQRTALLAGVLAGLSGLCRTEWGVAAIAGAALACVMARRCRKDGLVPALFAAAGYAATFGIGLGVFLAAAGVDAVIRDGHVLLTGLPDETRHFLFAFSGVRDLGHGLPELFYSAAMWVGVFLLAAMLARPAGESRTRVLRALVPVLLLLGVTALAGGAGGAVLFSAAPAVCLAGLVCGLSRRRGSGAAALSVCGLLGLGFCYRRIFHIGDSAYVAPPLLFAFVCAAGLLHLALARERHRGARTRLAAAWRLTVAGLVVLAFCGRAWQYVSIEGVPIAGTSGMLFARPTLAREIEAVAAAVRGHTREGDGLVVFPEGELLNLLSGRANPIRHMLYLPGYLTEQNEPAVLAELKAARPGAVVIWLRPTGEYKRGFFGSDYGRQVAAWIRENYVATPFEPGARTRTNPPFTVFFPRRGAS
ncbi:MAG: hypothetical protein ABI968_09555 [Acidobacteriota bacterium]